MKNVVRVDREFDDPLPPDEKNLDAVVCVLFYHDLFWVGADREKMNRAIFAALKPGGLYVIVDHAAAAGTGLDVPEKLHRIDPAIVRKEVEAAGFKFDGESQVLRHTADDHSKGPFDPAIRGHTDQFAYRFRKPK